MTVESQASCAAMASEGDSKRVLHRVKDTLKIEGPDPSITDLLDFYLNNTNMHGMRRIAVSKGPIKKTIWIVFSLIAVAMVFWQGIQLIQSFYSIAVSVTISYQKMPFPAITICSLNPYKYNQSQALLEKLDRNAAVALHNIGIAVTNLSTAKRDDEPLPMPLVWLDTTVTNQTVVTDVISGKFHVVPGEVEMRSYFSQNYQSSEPLIAIEVCGEEKKCIYNAFTSAIDAVMQWYRLHFINIMAIVPEKDKDKLGYSSDEFIIGCLFSGTVCDPSTSFKKLQHPILGNCFTFNDGRDGKSLDIASAGIDYGLHMILNTRQDNALPYLAMGAGAKIGIHLQNTTPFIEAVGINIPPATESSLGLRVYDVQKLGEPYSDCTMDGSDIDVKSLYDSPYSVQTCQNSCFQLEMIKSCGCANYEQPLPEGSRFCNYDNNPGWEYCYYRLYDMYIKEELKCIQVCRQICSETEHEVTLSLADWPSKASKGWLLRALSEERGLPANDTLKPSDIAIVNIYFKDLTQKTISESPASSIVTLLSNLGGLLGLWLSCSMLCVVEVLEIFCVDFPWILLKKLLTTCRRTFASLVRGPDPAPSVHFPVQLPVGGSPAEDPPTFHTAMQCPREPIPTPNTPPPQYDTLRLRQIAGYVPDEGSDGED
ncbi:unnamed protein product [Lampetra fluviatilis]